MKKSELKHLLKEQVRIVLNEATKAPVYKDIKTALDTVYKLKAAEPAFKEYVEDWFDSTNYYEPYEVGNGTAKDIDSITKICKAEGINLRSEMSSLVRNINKFISDWVSDTIDDEPDAYPKAKKILGLYKPINIKPKDIKNPQLKNPTAPVSIQPLKNTKSIPDLAKQIEALVKAGKIKTWDQLFETLKTTFQPERSKVWMDGAFHGQRFIKIGWSFAVINEVLPRYKQASEAEAKSEDITYFKLGPKKEWWLRTWE